MDQKAVQQHSKILMLETKLKALKNDFERLSVIHSKCRSQKEKVSVGIQTLTDDEVTVTFTVYLCSYINLY